MRSVHAAFVISCIGAALAIGVSACGSSSAPSASEPESSSSGKISVVTAFYPLQWVAERVGGSEVAVTSLTPEGAEPHDVTLDAKALESLRAADVVLYIGDNFQPEVQKAVKGLPSSVRLVDVLALPDLGVLPAPRTVEGQETAEGASDPHVWLDPIRMNTIAKGFADALTGVDSAKAAAFTESLKSVDADLNALNESTAAKLKQCTLRSIVTSHAAFQYYAQRYNLQQIAITGVSPEEEPDPKTLQRIAQTAKDARATTVYFEDALPSKLSETVASEIGAKTDLLSALEFDPAEVEGHGDYLSVQTDNANRLVKGLACSS